MENRKFIRFENDDFILKESYVASNNDTVWDVTDKSTKNLFVIHSTAAGKMYITFFKGCFIQKQCSVNALKKVCEILISRGIKPSIKIRYDNTALIALSRKAGFRKVKSIKNLYCFYYKSNNKTSSLI